MPIDQEKLARLQKLGASVRTGGKGSVRRKQKRVHKASNVDDKRLNAQFKRLGLNAIPGIEEVNLFKKDNTVMQFTNPRLQAAPAANTYVVQGHHETKNIADILPDVLSQLGPESLEQLKNMVNAQGAGAAGGADSDDDEDVPDLVDGADFEKTSEQ
eukprot:TRINITY_DN235_c0_g1_i1.p1 TRINITY_DN235_c0_g1~~TRINITY_DN235_c0_g1_i1.p1  ORF type:complete len:157 (-),score=60.38 TRINITY_DN235_c0_g1_i1:262-732(-)